jgi:hypothetical protein
MKSRVYKIKYDQSSFQLNEEYDRLSEYEKEKIADLDADSFFDYQDYNDKYVCYIITTPAEVKKYSSILLNNLIQHEIIDLTENILKFKINLEEELKPLLSTINSIKYSFFIDDLNDWILENLEIDNVLDRISEVGMENLTTIEKDFLKSYHN